MIIQRVCIYKQYDSFQKRIAAIKNRKRKTCGDTTKQITKHREVYLVTRCRDCFIELIEKDMYEFRHREKGKNLF